MALSSMTGFARSHGASGPYTFEWELKSVNAKGFDLRVRLPQGFDELEAHAKKSEAPLVEVHNLLKSLNDTWMGVMNSFTGTEDENELIASVSIPASSPYEMGLNSWEAARSWSV